MKWTHINEAAPEPGSVIVVIHEPYEDYKGSDFPFHYTFGMKRTYDWGPNNQTHEQMMQWCKDNDVRWTYWWMYAKDFPFPTEVK